MEVVLIVYLMCASVVGVYSTPRLNNLLPKIHDTPMTKVVQTMYALWVGDTLYFCMNSVYIIYSQGFI